MRNKENSGMIKPTEFVSRGGCLQSGQVYIVHNLEFSRNFRHSRDTFMQGSRKVFVEKELVTQSSSDSFAP